MLPPVSLPISNAAPPAETIAPAPPLLPPGVRVTSKGLLVRPKIKLLVSGDKVNSGVLVFPSKTAPAFFNLFTKLASS